MRKKCFVRLTAALYALAVVLLVVMQLVRAVSLLRCEERPLLLEDAQTDAILTDYEVDWMGFETGDMLAQSTDPQLMWTLDDTVSGLSFHIRTSLPVKDMELYYTTAPGQDYSAERRLAPVESEPYSGYYVFRMDKPVPVHQLRLDPTSAAGSFMELTELTLNPAPTAAELWLPPLGSLLAAASAPLLTAIALREVAFLLPYKNKENG